MTRYIVFSSMLIFSQDIYSSKIFDCLFLKKESQSKQQQSLLYVKRATKSLESTTTKCQEFSCMQKKRPLYLEDILQKYPNFNIEKEEIDADGNIRSKPIPVKRMYDEND